MKRLPLILLIFCGGASIKCGPGTGNCSSNPGSTNPLWVWTEPGVLSLRDTKITVEYTESCDCFSVMRRVDGKEITHNSRMDIEEAAQLAIEYRNRLLSVGIVP